MAQKCLVVWLLLICVLTACRNNEISREVLTWQEQYDLGVRYLSEGNYEEAIIAFTAAIEIDPKQAPAYVGRGDAYWGIVLMGEESGFEKSATLPESCQEALEDYLTAISLDKFVADTYQKAAEVYVSLGDLDAAIALLEQGVAATSDVELRAYLTELQELLAKNDPLEVLVYQAVYESNGMPRSSWRYFYNDQGYLILKEYTHYQNGDAQTGRVQWEYTDDQGNCIYIPDRQYYSTDEEWEADKREEQKFQGSSEYMLISGTGEYAAIIYADPLLAHGRKETVLNASGIFQISTYNSSVPPGYSAVYTFDDDKNPVAISTYADDGALTGTAVLEWAVINPI